MPFNPLQYSCLENPMEGGAWQATVHGVAKSRTRLSDRLLTTTMWFAGPQFPDQGCSLCSLQWTCRILTTRPPGKIPIIALLVPSPTILLPSLHSPTIPPSSYFYQPQPQNQCLSKESCFLQVPLFRNQDRVMSVLIFIGPLLQACAADRTYT